MIESQAIERAKGDRGGGNRGERGRLGCPHNLLSPLPLKIFYFFLPKALYIFKSPSRIRFLPPKLVFETLSSKIRGIYHTRSKSARNRLKTDLSVVASIAPHSSACSTIPQTAFSFRISFLFQWGNKGDIGVTTLLCGIYASGV